MISECMFVLLGVVALDKIHGKIPKNNSFKKINFSQLKLC